MGPRFHLFSYSIINSSYFKFFLHKLNNPLHIYDTKFSFLKEPYKMIVGKIVKFTNNTYFVCIDGDFQNLKCFESSAVEQMAGCKNVPLGTRLALQKAVSL